MPWNRHMTCFRPLKILNQGNIWSNGLIYFLGAISQSPIKTFTLTRGTTTLPSLTITLSCDVTWMSYGRCGSSACIEKQEVLKGMTQNDKMMWNAENTCNNTIVVIMIKNHKIYDNMTKDRTFSTWSQVCIFMRKICHSQIPQKCNNLDHVRLLNSYTPLLNAQFWKPFTQTHFFSLRGTSNFDSQLFSFISHVTFLGI